VVIPAGKSVSDEGDTLTRERNRSEAELINNYHKEANRDWLFRMEVSTFDGNRPTRQEDFHRCKSNQKIPHMQGGKRCSTRTKKHTLSLV
jgi:hypothetical protein